MIEKNARLRITEAHVNSGKPENLAMRRAPEKVEAYSGPEHKIGSRDDVQYEDLRQDAREELGDLVVEE